MRKRPTNFVGLSQSELQEDSKTLLYEFEAMYQNAAGLNELSSTQVKTDSQRWQMNSMIEAFGIHCRTLISFFFDVDPRPTDVIASDFKLTNWSPIKTSGLDVAHKNANKQVAHITTERRGLNQSQQNQPGWDVPANLADVCNVMAQFLKAVPSQNLFPGVSPMMEHFIQNARALVPSNVAPSHLPNLPCAVPVRPQTHSHSPSIAKATQFGYARTAPTPLAPSNLKTD